MNTYGYEIAKPVIPQISREQFASMSREQQDKYLWLYKSQVAPKLEVFREHHAYKLAFGGRGGAKSWGFASLLVQKLSKEKRLFTIFKFNVCVGEVFIKNTDDVYTFIFKFLLYGL